MPNWCSNTVTIEAPYDAIMAIVDNFKQSNLLNYVVPIPEDLMASSIPMHEGRDEKLAANMEKYCFESWYEFCLARWGTKWEVDCDDPETCVSVTINENRTRATCTLSFQSAWSPPLHVYEELTDRGYHVTAYWYEPGMAFAGIYFDGTVHDYEIPCCPDEAEATLPAKLNEVFNIADNIREWEVI